MSNPTEHLPTNTVDPDLEPGQVVGEYEVEAKIGQGGFGAVFKATHPLIGKVVAVKVLARKFSVDPEMVSRFIAEARAVNQIRHRHIIDIFSFGQLPDGRHYYVMEYLDGEPLDARIDRGPIPLAEALPILRAIARALDAAHAKGIAHRDLKPENVFLVSDGDGGDAGVWPKLLDFGIAKLLASDDGQKHKTRTGIPIGTPYYMSPEQCRGKDVDHRTDYYAFGVVTYKMLTGVHPIDGDDYMSIMLQQLTAEPPPASTVNGALPPAIDEAIAWLMKKDPSERPPNLITAIRAMEQIAEASGIAIPRTPQSAAWDATTGPTPTPTSIPRMSSAIPSTRTPTGMPNPALAATAPSGMVAIPARSRTPLYAAAAGAVVVGAIVFFVLSRGGDAKPTPVATPVQVAPPAPPKPAPPPPKPEPPPPSVGSATVLPAQITITIDGPPEATEVVLGGKPIGTVPGAVALDRGSDAVALTLRHPGFVPLQQAVVPDHAQTLHLKLHHAAAAVPSHTDSARDPHGIENPFPQ